MAFHGSYSPPAIEFTLLWVRGRLTDNNFGEDRFLHLAGLYAADAEQSSSLAAPAVLWLIWRSNLFMAALITRSPFASEPNGNVRLSEAVLT